MGIPMSFKMRNGGMISMRVLLGFSIAWLIGIQNEENSGLMPSSFSEISYSCLIIAEVLAAPNEVSIMGFSLRSTTLGITLYRTQTRASFMAPQMVTDTYRVTMNSHPLSRFAPAPRATVVKMQMNGMKGTTLMTIPMTIMIHLWICLRMFVRSSTWSPSFSNAAPRSMLTTTSCGMLPSSRGDRMLLGMRPRMSLLTCPT